MTSPVQINTSVENPEMHVLALQADGFMEQHAKKRLSSWPTRCFVKVHSEGLVIETQHVDMSRSPTDLTAGIRHQSPVNIELKINPKNLKELIDMAKKNRDEHAGRPEFLSAFLSEYREVIEILKRAADNAPQEPASKDIRELLHILSASPPQKPSK